MSGFGQNFGFNVGGGGIPYLTNLIPLPDDFIPGDSHVHLTLGVQGSLIDISKTNIYFSGMLVFDGSIPAFTTDFLSGSSFSYSDVDNGYIFDIQVPDEHLEAIVVVEVDTKTTDGTINSQSYSFHGGPDYPPMPFGVILGEVPLHRFSGESQTGLLAGANGLVFVSPALENAVSGNEIDVDFVESRVRASEQYQPPLPPEGNPKPFLVGPPPAVPSGLPWPPQFSDDYIPVLNDPGFALMNTSPQIVGVMVDTTFLTTSVILY